MRIITYDYIKFENKEYRLKNTLLESYFKEHKGIDLKPDLYLLNGGRIYTAKFEIIDDQLYLTQIIVGRYNANKEIEHVNIIGEVFKNQTKVRMDWINSTLILEPVPDFSKSDTVIIDKYIQIDITNGKQIKVKSLSSRALNELRNAKYKYFKKTVKYDKLIEEYKNLNKSWGMSDSYIKERILEEIFDLTTTTK